jgi:hypothetical protein
LNKNVFQRLSSNYAGWRIAKQRELTRTVSGELERRTAAAFVGAWPYGLKVEQKRAAHGQKF